MSDETNTPEGLQFGFSRLRDKHGQTWVYVKTRETSDLQRITVKMPDGNTSYRASIKTLKCDYFILLSTAVYEI